MRLKDYSLGIKKNIAVLLHMLFLFLVVHGITFIYLNVGTGAGISWIFDHSYEDSDGFQEQFQADLDHIFNYVSYRNCLESDGALDLGSQMFSVSNRDGPEIIYTLEEVLRYAKSQGYYLNDHFDVVNDMFLYDNAAIDRNLRINWRAYMTEQKLSEPGDAYTSLLELSKEVLHCLSEYYKVHYQMIVNPSNLYFQIVYRNSDTEQMVYTNCPDKSLEELASMGVFCHQSSDSIFIDTNLKEIPQNITMAMEKNDFYNAEDYYLMVAVDTGYTADDPYADAAREYEHLHRRLLESAGTVFLGLAGCLVTLYYLVLVSGFRDEARTKPYLHSFDTIYTESCVVLTAVCTLFMLFLGEKIGYPLLHLFMKTSQWAFGERMLRAVLVYGCCMIGLFSLLRRYKSRTLWEGSLTRHIRQNLSLYFENRTFSYRLLCAYLAFLGIQAVGFLALGAALYFLRFAAAKALLLVVLFLLIVMDYLAYHRLFMVSVQEDQIADAIARIAGGDTSYQMDTAGLTGKELAIAHMINRIGTGLEHALQEQVKSERLKADLITNVSHDIKTPLTSIINYVDLIKREQIQNEKVQEYLAVLEQKSQRLKNLTEDLVEASKASSGNLKLDMVRLDLVEMIWQTNGEFEEKFATRQLELVSTLPSGSMMIQADGRHLWRVLENLYNNAFKYAMASTRVYTDVTAQEEMVYFTIKNVSENPLNIKPDELTERFVRGDVSRTTEGSGLGLSIAQSLTRLQNGTFEILIDGDLFKVRVGFKLVE